MMVETPLQGTESWSRRRRGRRWPKAALLIGAFLWPLAISALEPLAVYEDWSQGFIRPDRWIGGETFGGQEVRRLVAPDHRLELRLRREGSTASNTGSGTSAVFLNTMNPTQINEIEANFTVTSLNMTVCASNNAGATTRARPAHLRMARFNDGTQSVPGNSIGDYLAIVQAYRDGSSTNPQGVLNVYGEIVRCTNPTCGNSTGILLSPVSTTVSVGQTFTLRLKWDQPGHQFLFGLDNSGDIAMPYSASDTRPASGGNYVRTEVNHTTANCTASPAAIDSTVKVGTVRTNSSAVIP